ncbi:hypothetical protein BP5796_07036 [Coleophoma crateriformis]|uniref:Uncharacterized protein n=1 Tax=Coleophoma crateriformis TaxID=565419 RepID=A0A3D8RI75_9HELO|nr:hypothetical protein BP5796_07036 [Coleophoma crateriformis]
MGKPGRRPKTVDSPGHRISFHNSLESPESLLLSQASPPDNSELQAIASKFDAVVLSTADPYLRALPTSEKNLINLLFDKDFFIQHFVFGPSFASGMQSKLHVHFITWPTILRESFLACSAGFVRAHGKALESSEMELSLGATALQRLRTMTVNRPAEVALVLSLGTALLTFELLTSSKHSHAIGQHTLSLLRPWYDSVALSPEMDMDVLCPLFLDTAHCLLKREVPVIRYHVRDTSIVDRYVGLSSTLLPFLYDVCILGHRSKHTVLPSNSELDEGLESNFLDLEEIIQAWRPSPPVAFAHLFSNHEIILLLTHARVYQEAALLILHRLRYPFGSGDREARLRSQNIFSEFEMCFSVTGQYAVSAALPFLVASLEVTDIGQRQEILCRVVAGKGELFHHVARRQQRFLEDVWLRRDQGKEFSWFDLVDGIQEFDILL